MIYFLYLVFAIMVVCVELSRRKRVSLDYLTYFNVCFILGYVVTPALLYHYSEHGRYGRWIDEIFLLTLIAYLSAMGGWFLGGKAGVRQIAINDRSAVRIMSRYTILVVAIALIYIMGKGGIVNFLSSGALIRYRFEDATPTFVDFLKNVYSLAEIVTYVLFAMMLSGRHKSHRKVIGWSYLVVLALYVLYMLSTSSRGAFANAFIIHSLLFIHFRGGFLRSAIPLLLSLVVLTVYGKQMLFATASFIRGGSFVDAFIILNDTRDVGLQDNQVLEKIVKEFSHTIDSLVAVLSAGDAIQHTYFLDFFLSVLRVIPQRIMMQFVDLPATISSTNTNLLIGEKIASIPPGLIAHFYHSLGLAGIVFGFLAYGFVGRRINENIASAMKGDDIFYAIYVYTGLLFGIFVANGDPNVFFYDILWPIVMYFSLSASRKKLLQKKFAPVRSGIDKTNQ